MEKREERDLDNDKLVEFFEKVKDIASSCIKKQSESLNAIVAGNTRVFFKKDVKDMSPRESRKIQAFYNTVYNVIARTFNNDLQRIILFLTSIDNKMLTSAHDKLIDEIILEGENGAFKLFEIQNKLSGGSYFPVKVDYGNLDKEFNEKTGTLSEIAVDVISAIGSYSIFFFISAQLDSLKSQKENTSL